MEEKYKVKCGICGKEILVKWSLYSKKLGCSQVVKCIPDAIYVEHGYGWVCYPDCFNKHPLIER